MKHSTCFPNLKVRQICRDVEVVGDMLMMMVTPFSFFRGQLEKEEYSKVQEAIE